MSAIGTKQTWAIALHMSAIGVKRTSVFAAHMSAFDPKRTSGLNISRSPLRRKVVGFKPCTKCVFGGP